MAMLFPDASVRGRFGTSFWALADQGAVSLGNFMTQIVLARSLSHSEYGIFALIFGVLLFLFTCQSGLIAYPLSLEGAAADNATLPKVAFAAAFLTILLAIPFSSLVIGATVFLHVMAITWAVLLAMLLWQLQETFRRALMSHLRHDAAIWGDALSYGGQAVLVWLLARDAALTLQRVFLVVAVTSAAAAIVQSIQVGWSAMPLRVAFATARKYWSSGKWALLTGMNESGIRQAFPWMLALLYSPAEAASFQAVMNLVGVSHPVMFGTSNIVIPAAADAKLRRGAAAAFRTSSWYGAFAVLLVLPFFGALFFWPHPALALFYGKLSPYVALSMGVRIAAFAYLVYISGSFLSAYLFGIGRPKHVFAASAGSTVVALIPAAILVLRYGVVGAIVGFLTFALVRVLLWAFFAARTLRVSENSQGLAKKSLFARFTTSIESAAVDPAGRK